MSSYVNAQKLNRRLLLQRRVSAVDAWGQPATGPADWEDVFWFWGHVKTINGSSFVNQEFVAASHEVSRPTASIRARRRTQGAQFEPTMRVVHRVVGRPDVLYDIRVVLPDLQDNRYVDLGVAAGANRG